VEENIMNLIVGSTGLLGLEIARQLRPAARSTRALVRRTADPAKRAELEKLGIELAEGDLKDAASLRRACTGVQTVLSTASSTFSRQEGDSIHTVDEVGQLALVDAAKASGVKRFVFISYRAKPQFPCPLSDAKQAVEQRLKSSGVDYVILRASYFMEVWLTPALGFDPLNGKVRIYGDGQSKLSWVSFKDVACIAAAAAHQPAARNRVFEVGGPQPLSPLEVVRGFEAAGAAEIAIDHVPISTLQEQYDAATDPMQKSFAALMLGYAVGDAMDIMNTTAIFPMRLRSVREYVSTVLAQRQPAAAHPR
jgi:uncharacterized protein YbjT (DUF2867 family)